MTGVYDDQLTPLATTGEAGPAAPEGQAPDGRAGGDDHASKRLHSLDAVRGLAIIIMLVAMNPGPLQDRPEQLAHPGWHGLTFADLFFPLFLFAVGVSMTLSSRALDTGHVLRRAAVLFALGVLLATLRHEQFGITGVLQHIAGSYVLAFAVLRTPRRWHLPLTVGIVVTLWAAFVLWAAGGDPWANGDTLAHAVDGYLLGGFTTEGTLQTVMSTVTVLAGAFAGRLVKVLKDRPQLVRALALRAAGFIALGLLIALVVPINKRLWNPSFTVLTVGTSFAWFALGVWVMDVKRIRRPLAPLIHVGTNPIAIYVLFMASLAILRNYGDHLTPRLAPLGSPGLGFLAYAVGWTVLWWLFAGLLYRRRIFVKV